MEIYKYVVILLHISMMHANYNKLEVFTDVP